MPLTQNIKDPNVPTPRELLRHHIREVSKHQKYGWVFQSDQQQVWKKKH